MMDEYFVEIFLTGIVLAGFMLDWLTVVLNLRKLERIAKPLAMVLLILWTLILTPDRSFFPLGLLIAAQVFGLIGDICLMFSGKWFLFGLAAFLTGHFFYIGILIIALIGLFQGGVDTARFPVSVILYMLTSGSILFFFYQVFKPLRNPEKVRPAMWTAVQIYGWVLEELVALTVFFVLISQPGQIPQYFLTVGAFLFLFSDSLLAYNKFINPIRGAHLWVHLTYHLAQFCLAVGFLSII